jgi:hypothetical protein
MSPSNLNDSPEGTIPVDQAIQLTANWRTYLATSGQAFVGQSFLIPISNFQNILQYNPDADGVRAYIGLPDPADPTTAQLLLVAVKNGQDVVYLPGDDGEANSDGSNVYDFSKICPPYCPAAGSPLDK